MVGIDKISDKIKIKGVPFTKQKKLIILEQRGKRYFIEDIKRSLFLPDMPYSPGDSFEGYGIKYLIIENRKEREIIIPKILKLKKKGVVI